VRVFDGKFYATSELQLQLLDRNDNPPVIHGPRRLHISEAEPVHTRIAEYTATDKDKGDTVEYVV
jgi:hypothetical protein